MLLMLLINLIDWEGAHNKDREIFLIIAVLQLTLTLFHSNQLEK